MVKKKVVWDESAQSALKEAYDRIKQNSLQQAEKVKLEIIAATKKLSDHPEMYPRINTEQIKTFASALLKNTVIACLTSLQTMLFAYFGSGM
jgi:plasmid stabilization system protein ParE